MQRMTIVFLILTACGGPNLSQGARIDEGDPSSKDPGISAEPPSPAPGGFPKTEPPPLPAPAKAPDVACGGALDGGVLSDGGSPCDVAPASECTSKTERVEWLPGVCGSDNKCVFSQSISSCPKGCFKQVDGGDGCAR